jgi:hypothetical protein
MGRKKALIRTAVLAIVGVAVAVGWKTNVAPEADGKLPNEALDSAFILRVEHGFVALAILLFALVVVVKGLWDGELPTKIGREGAEYQATADQTEKAIESVTQLSNRRWAILSRIGTLHERRLTELGERVQKLEQK